MTILSADQVRTIDEKFPRKVKLSTFSLVVLHGNESYSLGTGNLLRLGAHVYVITAAHVVHQLEQETSGAYVPTSSKGIKIPDTWHVTSTAASAANDFIDLAACRLTDDADPRLNDYMPITLADLDFTSSTSYPGYMLAGYPTVATTPGTVNGPGLSLRRECITTCDYSKERIGFDKYDAAAHLLLDADRDAMVDPEDNPIRFTARTGFPVDFPRDLGGISGAGIWSLGSHELPFDQWFDVESKLVAIQTGVYSDRNAIKGTRIHELLGLLEACFPEAKRVLRLKI